MSYDTVLFNLIAPKRNITVSILICFISKSHQVYAGLLKTPACIIRSFSNQVQIRFDYGMVSVYIAAANILLTITVAKRVTSDGQLLNLSHYYTRTS